MPNFKILGLVVMEEKIFKWLNFHIFPAHYICKRWISGHPEGLELRNLQHRLIFRPQIFCQNFCDLWPLHIIIIWIPNCRETTTPRGPKIVAYCSQQDQFFCQNFWWPLTSLYMHKCLLFTYLIVGKLWQLEDLWLLHIGHNRTKFFCRKFSWPLTSLYMQKCNIWPCNGSRHSNFTIWPSLKIWKMLPKFRWPLTFDWRLFCHDLDDLDLVKIIFHYNSVTARATGFIFGKVRDLMMSHPVPH